MRRTKIGKAAASLALLLAIETLLTGCGQPVAPAGGGATPAVTKPEQKTEEAKTEGSKEGKGGTEQGTEGTTEKGEPVDHGTLKVAFPAGNIRISINILAQQKGYFAEEGVTVEEINLMGNNALTAINDSDQLDILTVGFVPDLQAIASGYDLTFIAGTAVEGGALIAKKGEASKYQDEDKIVNVEAIANASLGLVRNEASWVVTRAYLLDNGISEETIAKIEDEADGSISYYAENTETAQAVGKGSVEVGFLPMEFALLYADAYDLEIIAPAGALQPDYVCCREVTSPSRLESKSDAFTAYEKARIRAFEFYKKGETDQAIQDEVVKIVADYSGKETDYVKTYLYEGVTKFATDPNETGIVKYVDAAVKSGALSSAAIDFGSYDITQNVDTSNYEKALKELIAENADNTFYADLLKQYEEANTL